jgi:hypothetical protein
MRLRYLDRKENEENHKVIKKKKTMSNDEIIKENK